jgi:magnesium transporter
VNIPRKSRKVGLPPGSLVYTGAKKEERVHLSVIDYDEHHVEERQLSIKELATFKRKKSVSWINVDGIHDVNVVKAAGEAFKLHPLLMEDILSTDQRPKFRGKYDDHIYIVLRMMQYNEKRHLVGSEQLSLVFGKNFVLSFQESKGDLFDMVRERIRKAESKIRKRGADYIGLRAHRCRCLTATFLILEHFL